MLLVLMGKTCSGKNTVVTKLKKNGLKQIVTYTTRPKRKGEREGREYHFISQNEFNDKINHDFFAEYKSYNVNGSEWFYGSPLKEIKNAISSEDKYVIILTPKGVDDVRYKIEPFINRSFLVTYLYSNRHTIITRLKKRRDSNDSIERRMNADNRDFKNALNICDKIVYNNNDDNIDDVVKKIIKIIDKNFCEIENI